MLIRTFPRWLTCSLSLFYSLGTFAQQPCSAGMHWDDQLKKCVCDSGTHWDEGMQMCMPDAAPSKKIQIGFHLNQFLVGGMTSGARGKIAAYAPDMWMIDVSKSLSAKNEL